MLQSTGPFQASLTGFQNLQGSLSGHFQLIDKLFQFLQLFKQLLSAFKRKNSLARSSFLLNGSICFSFGLSFLQAFWSPEFEHVFLSLQLDAACSLNCQSPEIKMQSKKQMRQNKNRLLSTHQPIISLISSVISKHVPGPGPWCQDKGLWSLSQCPSICTVRERIGRIKFCGGEGKVNKILWWNLWQNQNVGPVICQVLPFTSKAYM